ncbi:beta-ketoacyl-ACP synthase II [Candidatus Marinimicrobia bacterium]|nr:beta-ketoacyl-ACP synthase II [Candidatus Neomarinimicrobiota bacterium]
MKTRVVVTGMGVVSPIGNNLIDFWESLKIGKNGISDISYFDTEKFDVKIAGECNLDLNLHFNRKELNKLDRFSIYAIVAAKQAIEQSCLLKSNIDKDRVGVIVGSGIGGIATFEKQYKKLLKSPRFVSPFFIPSMISDIAPGHISIKYGFRGPNYSVVSACATSNHAFGDAFKMIQSGLADVIIAGGCEAAITEMSIAGFSNMKALSKNNDINTASRPFDKKRDGFVMGEGAGILVLESYDHARKRKANILAEIAGYGASGDAFHITSPDPEGKGAKLAILNALKDAKIKEDDIQYINAHGTSTPYNDKVESKVIKEVFKNNYKNIFVNSTKSMTGHLLGAAGGIEAVATILSMKNNFLHPTINYTNPDPDCNLNYIPNKGISAKVNYALSNNFGFGGHNSVIVFKGI